MATEGALAVAGQNAMYLEEFHWSYIGLAEMMKTEVLPDLIRRAILVETYAKSGWNAPPGPPGGKPGVRTGRLRSSITWWPGVDATSPYVDIGTNVEYGLYVEMGTSRMAARPYLRPALEAARANY